MNECVSLKKNVYIYYFTNSINSNTNSHVVVITVSLILLTMFAAAGLLMSLSRLLIYH